MYLDHFGLRADPFSLSPSLDLLFISRSHEETMAHLVYGLDQGEEIILLSGQVGMGKTLALHSLLARVSAAFTCVMVSSTKLQFRELLKMVLFDLKVKIEPQADLADLLAVFKARLSEESSRNRKLLLIIDEAQNLDADALENVRLLQNLASPGKNNLQLVLSGQPGLETTIARPELLQLRQRIRVHYRMEPLTRAETEEYLDHRTKLCGQDRRLFKKAAVDEIYRRSNGNPRLVNHSANQALLSAYVAGNTVVEARDILGDAENCAGSNDTSASESNPAVDSGAREIESQNSGVGADTLAAGELNVRHSRGGRLDWRAVVYPVAIIVCATALYFFWPTLARNRPETHASAIKSEVSTMIGEDTAIARDSVRVLPVDVDSIAEPRAATDIPDSLIVVPKLLTARDSSVVSPDTSIIRASSPVAAVEPPTAIAAESVAYAVHVASFLQPERAISMAQHFKEAGYPAEYRENKIANTIWHRVILGPYLDRAAAVAAGRAVVDAGLTTYTKVVEF